MIIGIIVVAGVLWLNKFFCEMLTPNIFHTSNDLSESKRDGFFHSFYEIVPGDQKILDELGFTIGTIWSEQSWVLKCTYLGRKKSAAVLKKLIFPVKIEGQPKFYQNYSFELDNNKRDTTTGFDLINYRYAFSPKEFSDTIFLNLFAKEYIEKPKSEQNIEKYTPKKTILHRIKLVKK